MHECRHTFPPLHSAAVSSRGRNHLLELCIWQIQCLEINPCNPNMKLTHYLSPLLQARVKSKVAFGVGVGGPVDRSHYMI